MLLFPASTNRFLPSLLDSVCLLLQVLLMATVDLEHLLNHPSRAVDLELVPPRPHQFFVVEFYSQRPWEYTVANEVFFWVSKRDT